jgi:hypothetical protein
MALSSQLQSPVEYFFGLALTTHRDKELGSEAVSYFVYEGLIAAIAILFFRSTVQLFQAPEPRALRWFFAVLLAALAYFKKSYELIMAVQIFSFAVPWVLSLHWSLRHVHGNSSSNHTSTNTSTNTNSSPAREKSQSRDMILRLVLIAASAVASLIVSHVVITGSLYKVASLVTPRVVVLTLEYLFPIAEMKAAYAIMAAFADPAVLEKQAYHLLFVTFHIQVGMGYVGIDFLRKEQHRRNQLVRLDVADAEEDSKHGSNVDAKGETLSPATIKLKRSQRFQRTAAPFIVFTALPYMFQIILYGNINKFSFSCLQHDLHRQVRLNQLFDNDSHLLSLALDSPISPECKCHLCNAENILSVSIDYSVDCPALHALVTHNFAWIAHSSLCSLTRLHEYYLSKIQYNTIAYANSISSVASTVYDMFNRKMFSLPKVLLLPAVMARQPLLVAQVFPFIFLSDWIKASAVSFMTTKIESLEKESQDARAIRSKVEAFDMKNAELLQRSGIGATRFTQRRWEELTVKVQAKDVVSDLLSRSKGFFSFIQRNFVFSVLIDCALANLIAAGMYDYDVFVCVSSWRIVSYLYYISFGGPFGWCLVSGPRITSCRPCAQIFSGHDDSLAHSLLPFPTTVNYREDCIVRDFCLFACY